MLMVYTHACTHTKHSHNINEQITLFLKKGKSITLLWDILLWLYWKYCCDWCNKTQEVFRFLSSYVWTYRHTGPTYGTIRNESFSVCQSAPKWWQRDIINYEILTSDPYHQQLLLKLTHLWWTPFLLTAFYLVSVFPVLFLSCVCFVSLEFIDFASSFSLCPKLSPIPPD